MNKEKIKNLEGKFIKEYLERRKGPEYLRSDLVPNLQEELICPYKLQCSSANEKCRGNYVLDCEEFKSIMRLSLVQDAKTKSL